MLEVLAAGTMRFVEITDDGGEDDLASGDVLPENVAKVRQRTNPGIRFKPTIPGLSKKPLASSTDLLERMNFQRLEDTLREIPAAAGTSDLTGSKSPIPGLAYGAMFRPDDNQRGFISKNPVFQKAAEAEDDGCHLFTLADEW